MFISLMSRKNETVFNSLGVYSGKVLKLGEEITLNC